MLFLCYNYLGDIMKETWDYLKNSGVYYLATIDGDQPRVRPFGVAEIFEDKLYIQTGKSKNVSKQIQENNNVELCAFNNGRWIRVTGKLVRDDRVEAKKDILDKNPSLRGMYDENDDNTEVLYFESAKAVIYSFTEEPIEYSF